MRLARVAATSAIALVALACSAAPLPADLEAAEAHERAGRDDDALRAYERAAHSCRNIDDARRRLEVCSAAYLQRAELLVSMGRKREAVDAYLVASEALKGDAPAEARATLRAGTLLLSLGDDKAGYEKLWKVITDYPDEAFAADALKELLRDGRARNPQALDSELSRLSAALAGSGIADNLLFVRAELATEELDDPRAALSLYDQIASSKESGFYDDALFIGAGLARDLGDPEGAVRRLRALQETREVAWGAGSYFSVHLDDGLLLLGQILRDDLKRPKQALEVFNDLPELYPDSVLHDDALFEGALAYRDLGDTAHACARLQKLKKKYPESKYELSRAVDLRAELACSGQEAQGDG